FGWIGAGAVTLILLGRATGGLAIVLTICIIVYDAAHKLFDSSPVLMASCRFFLYLVAAAAAQHQATGPAIWSAFALAAYIIGLSFLARQESTRGTLNSWPCYLLAAPILLALVANAGDFRRS